MAFHQEKRIAIGMVGGGPGSGIGETHRIAMRIDNKCELIAGAFSRHREKSLVVPRISSSRAHAFRDLGRGAGAKRARVQQVSLWQPNV
jgi:hypothetical protein